MEKIVLEFRTMMCDSNEREGRTEEELGPPAVLTAIQLVSELIVNERECQARVYL